MAHQNWLLFALICGFTACNSWKIPNNLKFEASSLSKTLVEHFDQLDSKRNEVPVTEDEPDMLTKFADFQKEHQRQYASKEEYLQRYLIFRDNVAIAKKLQDTEQGSARYGVTQFSDMTEEEFKKSSTSGLWDQTVYDRNMKEAVIPDEEPPEAFDWRNKSVVSEVKNQGSCGSCWAFSVTGNIEGQWGVHKGKRVSLSEQELVDCDKLDDGCNGGLPTNAYQEIMRIGGLEGEKDYPYEGKDDKCEFDKSEVRVNINGYVNISQNEDDMKAWLYKNGPISIGINAFAMQFYMGGVSHPWKFLCEPSGIDHGVLIVGYGVEDGWFGKKPYWIVKNSWGASWGEKGYYRVYRGDGTCGLNLMASSATVAN